MKKYKGEKYIYFLMAYTLAKQGEDGYVRIGRDNGFKGGEQFFRAFHLREYAGKMILEETKDSPSFANFSRFVQVIENGENPPLFYEYINENGENCSTKWVH